MRIVVFGTGQIYREMKKYLSKHDAVVGFLDNNRLLWETQIDNITIFNPEDISRLNYDKIVLMSVHALEMRKQLLKLGCDKNDILHYLEYIDLQSCGELHFLFPTNKKDVDYKKRSLIITTVLGYDGGSIAAIYAALALQKKGYDAVIAAPEGNAIFIDEIRKRGISVILYKNLTYAKERELFWVNIFDDVLVNTFQMSSCAIELAKRRKVILWIHEPRICYQWMEYWVEEIQKNITQKNLKVYAVCSIARENFLEKISMKSIGILPYGIPDEPVKEEYRGNQFTFAMVGLISDRKGQDIFGRAIEKMKEKKETCTFLVIGKNSQDTCGKIIEEQAKKDSKMQLLGELPHEEVMKYWCDIDVLVVASREDMLPIVATEAMMSGKVCILSEIIGTAEYIQEGYSGLTFAAENSDELAEKMIWCVEHKSMLKRMGESSRKVYDKYFSMEVFGDRLEAVLSEEESA